MKAFGKLRQHFDWSLFATVALIAVLGVVNLYSATSSTKLTLVRQQLWWLALGSVVFCVSALVDYRVLNRSAYVLYALGLLQLLLVLTVGKSVNQAQRWLAIGPISFQPSEPMKVLLVIALAKYLHDDPVVEGRKLRHMAIPFLVVFLPVILVLQQPDLGTALLIGLTFVSVMMLTKLKFRSIVTLLLAFAVSVPLSWNYVLKDYQKRRIHTFLNPGSDPSGAGWQARQSVFAIGSGGIVGKGYMRGTQNRLHFVPERWTDFPFAVWAEEWGFLGSAVLLGVYAFLILWAVKLATQARDRFGAVLCVGIAALFFWHTVINVSMVIGLMPVVGVTLPLFSYGGTSVITKMCAAGLLMNVSIRKTSF